MPFTDIVVFAVLFFLFIYSLTFFVRPELATHPPWRVFQSWTTPPPRCLCLDFDSTFLGNTGGEASHSLSAGSLMQDCVHDSQTSCGTFCPRWALRLTLTDRASAFQREPHREPEHNWRGETEGEQKFTQHQADSSVLHVPVYIFNKPHNETNSFCKGIVSFWSPAKCLPDHFIFFFLNNSLFTLLGMEKFLANMVWRVLWATGSVWSWMSRNCRDPWHAADVDLFQCLLPQPRFSITSLLFFFFCCIKVASGSLLRSCIQHRDGHRRWNLSLVTGPAEIQSYALTVWKNLHHAGLFTVHSAPAGWYQHSVIFSLWEKMN